MAIAWWVAQATPAVQRLCTESCAAIAGQGGQRAAAAQEDRGPPPSSLCRPSLRLAGTAMADQGKAGWGLMRRLRHRMAGNKDGVSSEFNDLNLREWCAVGGACA